MGCVVVAGALVAVNRQLRSDFDVGVLHQSTGGNLNGEHSCGKGAEGVLQFSAYYRFAVGCNVDVDVGGCV